MKTLLELAEEKLQEIQMQRDLDVIKGKSTKFYDVILIPRMKKHIDNIKQKS